jgi:hypothetical protein
MAIQHGRERMAMTTIAPRDLLAADAAWHGHILDLGVEVRQRT